jgi:hypothetical protein
MTVVINGTTGITSVNGTSGAPSVTGTDTDTGIVYGTNTVSIATGGTERAVVDSSGNLGLGATPSAWGGSFKALQVGAVGSTYTSSAGDVIFGRNTYNNGTNSLYLTSNYASAYGMISGQHQWFTAASGTAGNAITFTQAMTLDASGNLGLGTTSPQAYSNYTVFSVDNATNGGVISVRKAGTSYLNLTAPTGEGRIEGASSAFLSFYTASSERARIDTSGNLLVGTTSVENSGKVMVSGSSSVYNLLVVKDTQSATYADNNYAVFTNSSSTIAGKIAHTGSTTVSYVTSSDYRLKENIAPMTGALAKVAQLKPVTYSWKGDGSAGEGFIAHELAEVCPFAVVGEKDAVNEDGSINAQGIDTSFLVATLTKAIQEQQAIITQLQADVAALKA